MRKFLLPLSAIVLSLSTYSVQAQAQNPAQQILESVRIGATLQPDTDLNGHLWRDAAKSPISLFLRGKNIQFRYTDPKGAAKRFHLQHQEGDLDISEMDDTGKVKAAFPAARLRETIGGTDVNFEDLSLRFLYWPNPVMEGDEVVNGEKCWKIRVVNPGNKGPYKIVSVWIQKKYGALWRIAGYTADGKLQKEFAVISVMKVGKNYTVKKLKVSPADTAGRLLKPTYIEFQKP